MSRLEYCAEAEPKLLTLRGMEPLAAYRALKELVGPTRYERDWKAAQKPLPALRDAGLHAMECYQTAYPLGHAAHRIHTGARCYRKLHERGECQCITCVLSDELGIHEAVIASEAPPAKLRA